MAPIALPAGQSALAELQIEPVLVKEQAAAADIAEGKEGFVARPSPDVMERRAQCPRGILRVQYLGVRFDPQEFRRDLLSLLRER